MNTEIAARPMPLPLALLKAMRPKQWTKNLFVYAGLVFTDRWTSVGIVTLGFALFCIASSSIYLLNDVLDREQDKLHPEKRWRPIASGALDWKLAAGVSVVFGAGSIAGGFALLNLKFGSVLLAYYVLQLAYNFGLKHQVLLDVFAIAAGFVLRAVAGAYAIGASNSVWLLVCTLQLALFLGFGKRRHELVSLGETAASHRRILSHYSMAFLDQLITITLAGLVGSYALYSIQSPTAHLHPGLVITLPNVMYGIFRYLYLIHVERTGGAPEQILLEDRPMQINLALWLAEVVAAFKWT